MCLGLLEGAVIWVPSDEEFLHKSGSLVVFDATGVHRSRIRVIPAFSPLASLPRRGSIVVCALRFRYVFRLFAFLRRGDGKWSVSLDIGTVFDLCGVPRVAGECTLDIVLSCGPVNCQGGWGVWDIRTVLV